MIYKIITTILIWIYIGLMLLILPLSIWLLFNAHTATGTTIAIAAILSGILPIIFGLGQWEQKYQQLWKDIGLTLGLVIIICLGLILSSVPSGYPTNNKISHQFTKEVQFKQYTLTNIVPEVEQVNLGFTVMPYLDPILTTAQSKQVTPYALKLYNEMERDPDFKELGSAMGWAYAELIGQPFDVGHYYLYIPPQKSDKPMPLLVFLHGSAGNFKVYTWLWSKLADRHGFVIASPSFGFGNWWRLTGSKAVFDVLDDVAKKVNINPNEVYLAGLSNGGIGVSSVASRTPKRFKGLILISPVMDTDIVDQQPFIKAWQNKPILLITGEEDLRIPIDYVNDRATKLNSGGVEVTFIRYPHEDHFLLFSQPNEVFDDISNWLMTTSDKL